MEVGAKSYVLHFSDDLMKTPQVKQTMSPHPPPEAIMKSASIWAILDEVPEGVTLHLYMQSKMPGPVWIGHLWVVCLGRLSSSVAEQS